VNYLRSRAVLFKNLQKLLLKPHSGLFTNLPWRSGATGSTYLLHSGCFLNKSGDTAGQLVAGIFLAGDKIDDLKLLLSPK
jgi:hypothetical protein